MLNKNQKKNLESDIQLFLAWLIGKLGMGNVNSYSDIEFSNPDNSDWFMSVFEDKVKFNTFALRKCSYEYYRLIVLHECFHLLVQNVPNKLDAKRLKDDFGGPMMVLLDIEADFYAYLFLREYLNYSLSDIFLLNFQGIGVFSDEEIRFPKFERFIGASISITNFYLNMTQEKELYLVSTKNIPTDESLHSIISKNNYLVYRSIKIGKDDIENMRRCYNREGLSKKEYAEGIINFSCKALGIDVPVDIIKELSNISDEE